MASDNGETVGRSRNIPAKFSDDERSIVLRAVEWRLAQAGVTSGTTPKLSGESIAAICREWITDNALSAMKARATE